MQAVAELYSLCIRKTMTLKDFGATYLLNVPAQRALSYDAV